MDYNTIPGIQSAYIIWCYVGQTSGKRFVKKKSMKKSISKPIYCDTISKE